MASRRMFSNRVTSSAKFLRMPVSSQCLYFHLGMYADDDGVVEAFPVLKMTGCTDDDLRILAAKGFLTVLNEDLVVYINDWMENNKIRANRKTDSIYKDLLIESIPGIVLLERKTYGKESVDVHCTTIVQPEDSQSTTDVHPSIGKDRLGKDRLGKDRLGEVSIVENNNKRTSRFTPPTLQEVKAYCQSRNNGVNPERFVDFYESKGWMVGKSKMKDWKAAVRTWEQRGAVGNKHFSTESDADYDDLAEKSMANLYARYGGE